MYNEKLANRWAANWEKLLDSRRSLLHWQEALKTAEENYERTQLDTYLDDIDEDQYAIQELENKIVAFKEQLESKPYDPYEVLELSWNASAEEIEAAYKRLYRQMESICLAWVENLDQATTPLEKVIYATNLEEARFILRQIVKAYNHLHILKP